VSFGDRKLGKQLSAADRAGAHFAVIIGDDELATESVTLKDLRDGGEQQQLPAVDLARALGEARGAAE
jgi:histidyl-tRNA synthetase